MELLREDYRLTIAAGALMYGPPGTGKTLLARACAAQTDATFLKLAGPQLVQMFIGDGAKLVRDCFALAKEKAPSIIFIDELDAIGTKRFDSDKSGDREVQRTMLELLNQLDGFASDDRIKVLAATNRVDVLDPALLRSGRLDRKIEFPLPNEEARAQILRIHSRKMTVDDAVNWPELARSTDEFGGAQLKAVCVEAGMIALRKGQNKIGHEHYVDAISEVQAKKKVSEFLQWSVFHWTFMLTSTSRTLSTSMLKRYLTTAAQAPESCVCKINGIEVRQFDILLKRPKHRATAFARLIQSDTPGFIFTAPCFDDFVTAHESVSLIFMIPVTCEVSFANTRCLVPFLQALPPLSRLKTRSVPMWSILHSITDTFSPVMPTPDDLHQRKKCGSKGSSKRATQAGLCKHKRACEGTSASPHNKWIMYVGEPCKLCKMLAEAAHRKEQEKRKHDEKKEVERGANSWYKEKPGRKKPGKRG